MLTSKILAGVLALGLSTVSTLAGDITILDSYFRTSGMMAKTGAAFMEIHNDATTPDRLISVRSDVAKKIETHTHIDAGNGVMQMREVEGGFIIPAEGMHQLARGGDHLMFMGLTRKISDGDVITVTLTFENAGDITVEIPVDLTRKPAHGAMKDQSGSDG